MARESDLDRTKRRLRTPTALLPADTTPPETVVVPVQIPPVVQAIPAMPVLPTTQEPGNSPTAPAPGLTSDPVQETATAVPSNPTATINMLQPNHFTVVTDLVQNILTQTRQPDQRFYLVVIPEDEHPRIEEFMDSTTLVARISGFLGQDVSLFPFLGYRLGITRGPNRFLQTPFGALPLFTIPAHDSLSLEDNGFVGSHPDRMDLP